MALNSKTEELDEYLRECVRIEPLAIEEEYVRIPGDLAYWNDQYARALRHSLRAKITLTRLRAELLPVVRQALIDAGGKTTESQVEAALDSNSQLVEAQLEHADAEAEKNRLFGVVDAIRAKKEMLISLGAHLRVEMERDPVIRDQVRGRRFMRDQEADR